MKTVSPTLSTPTAIGSTSSDVGVADESSFGPTTSAEIPSETLMSDQTDIVTKTNMPTSDQSQRPETMSSPAYSMGTSSGNVDDVNQTSPVSTGISVPEVSTLITSLSSEPMSDQSQASVTTSTPALSSIYRSTSETIDNLSSTTTTETFIMTSQPTSDQSQRTETTSSPVYSKGTSSENVDYFNKTSPSTDISITEFLSAFSSLSVESTSEQSQRSETISSPASLSVSSLTSETVGYLNQTNATSTASKFSTVSSSLSPESTFQQSQSSEISISPATSSEKSDYFNQTSPTSTDISVTKFSTTSTVPTLTFTSALTSMTMDAKTVIPVTVVPNITTLPSIVPTTPLSILTTTPFVLECKLSTETMVKTVLTVSQTLTDVEVLVQNWMAALNQTLYQVFKQQIQVLVNRTVLSVSSSNVTLGYSVLVNSSVYIPSAITEVLVSNDVLYVANLRNHIPSLQSVPVVAVPWEPIPDYKLQLKTVLKLMSTVVNIHSCSYVRNMEQKLQTAFEKAGSQNVTVQMLNTSQVDQTLTLIYVVKSGGSFLTGTTSSSILNTLTGEVVGYYLGDPPLIIAESLYYPNIDTSDSTRNSWVITVILGVDDTLLGINNQSFARTLEEGLAQLFQLSHPTSRRFKRETTVGSYTVQMVKMQRVPGTNNPAELTYYVLLDGNPIPGTVAAKQLNTIDPQTMALTLKYIVRLQAEAVINNPPNNLWIIAAVLAPISVVTVIIIIITAVLCRKNKNDFKSENMSNLPPRTKPIQGFDYAKQHLGQQGGDEEALPVTQETVVTSLNMSQERDSTKDGSTEKMLKSSDTRKSLSPCENGSVISNESEESSSDGGTPHPVMSQHRVTKEEAAKRNGFTKTNRKIVPISDEEEGSILFDKKSKIAPDPFDSSSGSVQLIAIKPMTVPPSHPVTDRTQELAIINGEVNKALKQKSDIEHYRNKLRLKAKRKGYYDFPPVESKSLTDRKSKMYEKTQMEINSVLDVDTDASSPFAEPKLRQPSLKNHPYRSRQSLNSPSPGETEMDLLVTRERPRRGIRNSGYDTEPEMIEETNIDRVKQARTFIKSRQAKGHSETSTLSSQPSIDEVRQQMHMLLEEAFSLASAGHGGPKRPPPDPYSSVQHMPYSEVVTSAPGTMSRPRVQWVPTYGPEMYQYSLPRPSYRFSQLPEMVMGSPPPPVPPRTGPVAVTSLQRSTSDVAKSRMPESSSNDQAPGNSVPAVFAIPGNRSGYSGYFIPQPPTPYRNQAWMPYSGDNELPGQWADSVPLPGYIEAYPRSRYPQNSPSRLPRPFNQPSNLHHSLDHAVGPSMGASQQSLADTDTPDTSITNLSTAALVKAIREEVAKLAKKQTDMFEFQV
ncbi:UPF0606 protein KIAA1549L homolog [Discoglossus pictus]